jgi:RNA polymerase-binding transcription factor DksA
LLAGKEDTMTPASKGAAAKKVPASRPAAAKKAVATKKIAPARAAGSAKKRPTLTKKAASVVKKAVQVAKKRPTSTQKNAPPAKKAAPIAKKAAPAPPAKKAAPAAKKAAAKASAKAPAKAPAKTPAKTVAVPVEPARTTFTPRPKPPAPVRPQTGPYAKDLKFLEEVKELLIADRVIYQEQATSLRAEADSLALEREPGDVQFDEESGEGGTVTVDRERNLALSGQAALAVEEIDYALERIVDKTYGYCERCFQPIPKPRLRALPYARLCVACKSGGLSRR